MYFCDTTVYTIRYTLLIAHYPRGGRVFMSLYDSKLSIPTNSLVSMYTHE
jgi:hypothetical protein